MKTCWINWEAYYTMVIKPLVSISIKLFIMFMKMSKAFCEILSSNDKQQLSKTYIMNINLPCYNPEDSELLYISQKQLKQSWISIQPKPCDVTDTKNEEKVWCVHPKSNSIIHNKKTFKVFFISMQEHFNLAKSNSWLLFFFLLLHFLNL